MPEAPSNPTLLAEPASTSPADTLAHRSVGEGIGSARAAACDAMYKERPPWDIGRPQQPFLALADRGLINGRVLDVGCGTGEHVCMAAQRGLQATGLDIAATAIEQARAKAAARDLAVRFVVHDVLDLTGLGEQFDTVIDSGLFHSLADDELAPFAAQVHAVLAADGHYLMLCFSDGVMGTAGPRRVRRDLIKEVFGEGWTVESIEPSAIEVTWQSDPVPAWLAVIRRV